MPDPDMIQLPKNWFTLETFKALRKACRGPISKSRRRMITFKRQVPREVFDELVSNMRPDDVSGVEWSEDGKMVPTKDTSSTQTFSFETKRPMVADRIFTLERGDFKGVHAKEGRGAWRRGLGCACLKLSDSAKAGATASAFAMVGGNVVVKGVVPKRWRAWPTLTLKFFMLTVDHRGNILWPTNWEPGARTLLKELARRKIEAFKADASYPIRPDFCDTPGATSSLLSRENAPRLPAPLPPPPAQLLLR